MGILLGFGFAFASYFALAEHSRPRPGLGRLQGTQRCHRNPSSQPPLRPGVPGGGDGDGVRRRGDDALILFLLGYTHAARWLTNGHRQPKHVRGCRKAQVSPLSNAQSSLMTLPANQPNVTSRKESRASPSANHPRSAKIRALPRIAHLPPHTPLKAREFPSLALLFSILPVPINSHRIHNKNPGPEASLSTPRRLFDPAVSHPYTHPTDARQNRRRRIVNNQA